MTTILSLLLLSRLTWATLQSFNLTLISGWAAPGCRDQLTEDGFWRQTYRVNKQFPGPLIAVDEGEEIEVNIQHNLPVENSIHWNDNPRVFHF
jgi:FtsP/CotA-like multicopper oxidase with cupredoxin domain